MEKERQHPDSNTADDSDAQFSQVRPFKKRRRVGLACRSCRRRKSRCDGQRPICTTCLDLGHVCIYEPPSATPETPATGKRRPESAVQTQRKQLRTTRNEDSPTDEEDIAVDALAPEALNEAPEPNIGHFGKVSCETNFSCIALILLHRFDYGFVCSILSFPFTYSTAFSISYRINGI